MARFCPLFSSSSGNCIYIGTSNTNILIDAGISLRKIENALQGIGQNASNINAIFVTHEHNDHIAGLSRFAKKYAAKIYASKKTKTQLQNNANFDGIDILEIENEVELEGVKITRFATSHDCVGSSGYRATFCDGLSFAVCTDTGIITDEIRHGITGCDLVMLESNHDINLLNHGPYTALLKARILSDKGHISNTVCAEEVAKLVQSGTTRIILGHLSPQNNTPELARETTYKKLLSKGLTEGQDYLLYVAPKENGKLFSF